MTLPPDRRSLRKQLIESGRPDSIWPLASEPIIHLTTYPLSGLRILLNEDHRVDAIDRDQLVIKTMGLAYGDANLDGRFDSEDLVAIFVAGQYDDNTVSNSTLSTGDWDGDGEFDDNDLAFALQQGQY